KSVKDGQPALLAKFSPACALSSATAAISTSSIVLRACMWVEAMRPQPTRATLVLDIGLPHTLNGVDDGHRHVIDMLFGIALVPGQDQHVGETVHCARERSRIVVNFGLAGAALALIRPVAGAE